jgi:hypothetical protein
MIYFRIKVNNRLSVFVSVTPVNLFLKRVLVAVKTNTQSAATSQSSCDANRMRCVS